MTRVTKCLEHTQTYSQELHSFPVSHNKHNPQEFLFNANYVTHDTSDNGIVKLQIFWGGFLSLECSAGVGTSIFVSAKLPGASRGRVRRRGALVGGWNGRINISAVEHDDGTSLPVAQRVPAFVLVCFF